MRISSDQSPAPSFTHLCICSLSVISLKMERTKASADAASALALSPDFHLRSVREREATLRYQPAAAAPLLCRHSPAALRSLGRARTLLQQEQQLKQQVPHSAPPMHVLVVCSCRSSVMCHSSLSADASFTHPPLQLAEAVQFRALARQDADTGARSRDPRSCDVEHRRRS